MKRNTKRKSLGKHRLNSFWWRIWKTGVHAVWQGSCGHGCVDVMYCSCIEGWSRLPGGDLAFKDWGCVSPDRRRGPHADQQNDLEYGQDWNPWYFLLVMGPDATNNWVSLSFHWYVENLMKRMKNLRKVLKMEEVATLPVYLFAVNQCVQHATVDGMEKTHCSIKRMWYWGSQILKMQCCFRMAAHSVAGVLG